MIPRDAPSRSSVFIESCPPSSMRTPEKSPYFIDMETGVQMRRKRYLRWKQKDRRARRDLPDAFKLVALRYVQKQPRMKTCKLSEIERVTRVNRTKWSETLPDLRGYEIVARGKTFFIKAPRADR